MLQDQVYNALFNDAGQIAERIAEKVKAPVDAVTNTLLELAAAGKAISIEVDENGHGRNFNDSLLLSNPEAPVYILWFKGV